MGAESPSDKMVSSELVLGGQLQVDAVIGMSDPFDGFVAQGFDSSNNGVRRPLVPDLPRCTTIQRAVHSKLIVMGLPIIQPLRQILGT